MLSQAKIGLGKKKIVPIGMANVSLIPKTPPKSEADIQWEQVEKSAKRPLKIKQVQMKKIISFTNYTLEMTSNFFYRSTLQN